jgi:hypothetical protein
MRVRIDPELTKLYNSSIQDFRAYINSNNLTNDAIEKLKRERRRFKNRKTSLDFRIRKTAISKITKPDLSELSVQVMHNY